MPSSSSGSAAVVVDPLFTSGTSGDPGRLTDGFPVVESRLDFCFERTLINRNQRGIVEPLDESRRIKQPRVPTQIVDLAALDRLLVEIVTGVEVGRGKCTDPLLSG